MRSVKSLNHQVEIQTLYHQLLANWNEQNAHGMAELFAVDGVMIGFDGSLAVGSREIFQHLDPVFESHETARFVSKVKNVQFLSSDVAMLRAIAGMIPPRQSDVNPKVNTHQTLVAVKSDGIWRIKLFQNCQVSRKTGVGRCDDGRTEGLLD